MVEVLAVGISLVVGFVVAFLLLRRGGRDGTDGLREAEQRAEDLRNQLGDARAAMARAEAERDGAREQLAQLKEDRAALTHEMRAISATQLERNRDEFLKQASERFGRSEEQHAAELSKRHEAIEKEFKGLKGTIEKFDKMQREIEEKRSRAFGSLDQQFTALAEQTQAVKKSSEALSTALRGSSQSRGRWGELALRNIVESAGMTEHCDFEEQQTDDDGRPDMIVRLPDGGKIPIDAKVPYPDYDRAMTASDPDQRASDLEAHGDHGLRPGLVMCRGFVAQIDFSSRVAAVVATQGVYI